MGYYHRPSPSWKYYSTENEQEKTRHSSVSAQQLPASDLQGIQLQGIGQQPPIKSVLSQTQLDMIVEHFAVVPDDQIVRFRMGDYPVRIWPQPGAERGDPLLTSALAGDQFVLFRAGYNPTLLWPIVQSKRGAQLSQQTSADQQPLKETMTVIELLQSKVLVTPLPQKDQTSPQPQQSTQTIGQAQPQTANSSTQHAHPASQPVQHAQAVTASPPNTRTATRSPQHTQQGAQSVQQRTTNRKSSEYMAPKISLRSAGGIKRWTCLVIGVIFAKHYLGGGWGGGKVPKSITDRVENQI